MRYLVILSLLTITACQRPIYFRENATPEELQEHYGPACEEEGNKVESAGFAKCIQAKLEEDRERKKPTKEDQEPADEASEENASS